MPALPSGFQHMIRLMRPSKGGSIKSTRHTSPHPWFRVTIEFPKRYPRFSTLSAMLAIQASTEDDSCTTASCRGVASG